MSRGIHALCVAVALALAACSGGSGHKASPGHATATTVALSPGPGTSPITAPGGGNVPLKSPSSPTTTTTATTITSGLSGSAARQAFDTWIGAVVQRDVPTMLNHSIGAAAALGALKITADQIVAGSGGKVSAQVTSSTLTPARVEPAGITFDGEVDVLTSISGRKGSTPTRDRITGPVEVRNDGGTWKVTTFAYDGAPLVYYPEGAEQTVNGVHLVVAFLLSNASSTNAVVHFYADKPGQSVGVQRVSLVTESGASQNGRAFFGRGVPAGVLGFPRVSDRPTRVEAVLHNGPSTFTLSVPLSGQPS